MSTDRRTRAWVEIDRESLRGNVRRVATVAGGTSRLLPVVKSNGYGLGLELVIRELEPFEPWGYGVAEVREAEAVRDLGITRPVLILNSLPPGDVAAAVEGEFHIAVSALEEIDRVTDALGDPERVARIHAEVDTGMGRAGFDWTVAEAWAPALVRRLTDRVRLSGVFTHFHSADIPETVSVDLQTERFDVACAALRDAGTDGWVAHRCNSAGAFRDPDPPGDLVRPGIFLYGGRVGPDLPTPEPVVTLRARVVLVRDVPAGTTLGYGATHTASRAERWATVAIGYGDGLPRALGNRGRAIAAGRTVPIIGRISMGLTVVDITNLEAGEVRVGDPVTFLGHVDEASISVDEIAELSGTISYEVFTGLSARLPRLPSTG